MTPPMPQAEAIISWMVAQAIAMTWLFTRKRSKALARVGLSLLFLWAAFVNWRTSQTTPEVYLDYARFAWSTTYAAFIDGWFSRHVPETVGTIALGQLVIALTLAGTGWLARVGLTGAILFFLAILPLGIGSGFPLPLLLVLGTATLYGSVDASYWTLARQSWRSPWAKALATWLGLFALAFVNGAVRELAIKRVVAEPWAHHASALTAILLFTAFVWFVWPRLKVESLAMCVKIGVAWSVLTVLCESLVLGRWLEAKSWREILAAYDLIGGQSWPYVVLWIGLLPALLWAVRRGAPRRWGVRDGRTS